jgi:hypothetical protein
VPSVLRPSACCEFSWFCSPSREYQKRSLLVDSTMNNTTATMDAAASVDSDLEKALWSETPETNYFKMMMEDNEMGRILDEKDNTDDSVLGGETLASMLGDKNYTKNQSSGNKAKDNAKVVAKSYSVRKHHASSLPAETMAIVGLEDDVSTIANDTVNETTKTFFNGQNDKQDSRPRIRLFKEYKTPEQAKKRSESSTENGEDEETSPETPPDMIRVPGKSKKGDREAEEGEKVDKDDVPSVRSKRVYVFAAVLAIILFASIIALSVALKGMQDDGTTSTSTSSTSTSANGGDGDDEDVFDDWPELNATINGPADPPLDIDETDPTNVPAEPDEIPVEPPATITVAPTVGQGTPVSTTAPSLSPIDGEFAFGPSLEPTLSTQNLTTFDPSMAVTSLEPSAMATTIAPSLAPSLDSGTFDDMLSILVDRGGVSADLVDSPESPQYQALTWLSADPNYDDYSENRAIQRWALAVFAHSLRPPLQEGAGRRAQRSTLPGWLAYSDECTWFTTSEEGPICDSFGMYETIDVRNLNLIGSLPSELALLSNSLRKYPFWSSMCPNLCRGIDIWSNALADVLTMLLKFHRIRQSGREQPGRTNSIGV